MIFTIHSKKYGPHKVEIDDEDAARVTGHTWRVCYRRRNGKDVLANIRTHIKLNGGTGTTSLYLHRLILPGCEMVDHIDGNVLNNTRANLRPCTASENMRNRKAYRNNKLQLRGVSFNSRINKFQAQIQIHKKHMLIGNFEKKEDAARAYNEAAKKYHGEFARLNEI